MKKFRLGDWLLIDAALLVIVVAALWMFWRAVQ